MALTRGRQTFQRLVRSNVGRSGVIGAGFQGGKQLVKYTFKNKKRKRTTSKKVSTRSAYTAPSQYSSKTKTARKRVDFKKKKVVSVSRPLRQKIKKVINGTMPGGFFHEINSQRIGLNGNQQNVGMIPSKQTVDLINGHHFSPTQILDAASILWNNKTILQNKTLTGAGNFNPETAVIDIVNCWSTIKMKNNSQRLYNVCIYTLDPTSDSANGTNPQDIWEAELLNQRFTGPSTNPGPNVNSITANSLYNNPKMLHGMNQKFKISKDYYEMYPGQEKNFKVQGPNNTRLDMAKCYRGNVYTNYDKKFSRFVMITVHGDLAGSTEILNNTFCGRPESVSTTPGYGLLIETNQYYSLKQPEQAGWYNPLLGVGTSTSVPLEMRRHAYCIKHWLDTIAPINNSTILENSPDDAVVPV